MRIDLLSAIALLFHTTIALAQPTNLAAIDAEVADAMRRWEAPGVTVVVVRPDRVDLVKGYGRRANDCPAAIDADTLFPLASCTKAFTSAALAALVDDRKVAWDDPVRKHLPTFRLADPHVDALVTVRDLLCHRTGLASHDYLWYRAAWSQEETLRRTGLLPLTGAFRASFSYQSVMFMAAGNIVAKHHEDGWAGFVSERLLGPLGMTQTVTTSTDAARRENRAVGHRRDRADKMAPIDDYPMPEANAAGSLYTTPRDLAKWLQFQLGDGRWRGKRLVSAAALAETHRPQNIIPPGAATRAINPDSVQLTYTMGWVLQDYRGEKVLAHAGRIDGFRCQLTLLPERGFAIGLMCNLDGTRMNLALTNRLVDLLAGLPEKDWHAHYGQLARAEDRERDDSRQQRDERRRAGKAPSLPLAAFTGAFEHPAYGVATLELRSSKLVWKWSSFERELLPIDGDAFELRDVLLPEQEVTFVIDQERPTKMKALGVEFARRAK